MWKVFRIFLIPIISIVIRTDTKIFDMKAIEAYWDRVASQLKNWLFPVPVDINVLSLVTHEKSVHAGLSRFHVNTNDVQEPPKTNYVLKSIC